MEKAEILKRLESCIDIENGIVKDGFKFIQLKNELLEDVKKEACKKSGTKASKLNAIKRVLKASERTSRPILTKYDIQDGKMVFTDSYQAFRINDLESNPFEKVKDSDGVYPSSKNWFPELTEDDPEVTLDKATIRAIKKTIKNSTADRRQKTYQLEGVDSKVVFDYYLLVNMLDIMPEDTKYYFARGVMILGISESTGDTCLTLGIRTY